MYALYGVGIGTVVGQATLRDLDWQGYAQTHSPIVNVIEVGNKQQEEVYPDRGEKRNYGTQRIQGAPW